jgi:type IX secretion system PorP/SprF family membrane protein
MKKLYSAFSVLLLASVAALAQQEPMHTQFFFNKLAHNPAYAGSELTPEITAAHRSQWIGLEGAPNIQNIAFNQPIFNKRVGIGANLSRYSLAITRAITLDMVYAYRIEMTKGTLGIGIQAGARHFYQNWNDPRIITDVPRTADGAIPTAANSKVVANFGAGFYYKTETWYAGIAGKRLYNNNIDFADKGQPLSREVIHLNAMFGSTFSLNDDWKLLPQVLLKYVPNAPFDADLNATFSLKDKFFGGLTYRTGNGVTASAGESVDVLLGMQATENVFFCLSYDIGLTPLRKHSSGTIEATVRYQFNPPASGTAVVEGGVDFLKGVEKKGKGKKKQ